ncbi:hypothetical protein OSH11_04845 [Kaistia dalseonensis]|uniref:Uncharacterized protein n=1 Tax=Kaistia dalseonensis TaxID=410840 RepID=A0ABU0H2R1_9HYPH|nr:hypothetical protein [Kaistia dalseonensis]MCX5494016.1 hypothetical protein [Kaistia dalseonensis]MDQ0436593.1 hypothetical protein [Kaistia dalseonensis]
MSLIPGATQVFSVDQLSTGCAVIFLAKRVPASPKVFGEAQRLAIGQVLAELADEGWQLSVRAMFDPSVAEPMVFDTGFAHNIDLAGVFEAPSVTAALEGTVRLEAAGWNRRFDTEWLIGPRELSTVKGIGDPVDRPWGFVAFWEWNDARTAASPEERRRNDADCDIAFQADLDANINMTGRHRTDWMHGWQHLSIWEATSPELIDHAMYEHERVLDFRFTTSRHYVGRRRPLADFLATN